MGSASRGLAKMEPCAQRIPRAAIACAEAPRGCNPADSLGKFSPSRRAQEARTRAAARGAPAGAGSAIMAGEAEIADEAGQPISEMRDRPPQPRQDQPRSAVLPASAAVP